MKKHREYPVRLLSVFLNTYSKQEISSLDAKEPLIDLRSSKLRRQDGSSGRMGSAYAFLKQLILDLWPISFKMLARVLGYSNMQPGQRWLL